MAVGRDPMEDRSHAVSELAEIRRTAEATRSVFLTGAILDGIAVAVILILMWKTRNSGGAFGPGGIWSISGFEAVLGTLAVSVPLQLFARSRVTERPSVWPMVVAGWCVVRMIPFAWGGLGVLRVTFLSYLWAVAILLVALAQLRLRRILRHHPDLEERLDR